MTPFQIAESALINTPIGSVVKVGAAIGWRTFFYQNTDTGIVSISPGAYCRALGL
jgi:hypothetical protein